MMVSVPLKGRFAAPLFLAKNSLARIQAKGLIKEPVGALLPPVFIPGHKVFSGIDTITKGCWLSPVVCLVPNGQPATADLRKVLGKHLLPLTVAKP